MRKLVYLFILGVIYCCTACSEALNNDSQLFRTLTAEQSGIAFTNELEDSAQQNILDYLYYYNGGGIAVADFDNDSLPDIYLASNQKKNQLYWNKGNLNFEKAKANSGLHSKSNWNTGVTTVDINGDGYLDIYQCAVSGLPGFVGKNELFINQKNGTFKENAASYNLDIASYSTHAGFFDYDQDGDLDLFLLNHAIHNADAYGKSENRTIPDPMAGDKLFRNQNGSFIDVTAESGIFSGSNGYGLDFAFSDFNNDGWVDIYVGNDFHEDDYLYINQQDGTFLHKGKQQLTHTSKFTMGVVAADFNNDGFSDVFTTDMLPYDEVVLKKSANDDGPQIQDLRTKKFGYQYQYARNNLQMNKGGQFFSEQALLHTIAATDWSWSALAADFDLDGYKDLYISNGIPKRPNDLDYLRYLSNGAIRERLNKDKSFDSEVLKQMPTAKLPNAIFKGTDSTFLNKSAVWAKSDSTFTTAATYADLDRDGDLDLVLNHINKATQILENTTENYSIAIRLYFTPQNPQAIGAKVILQDTNGIQQAEVFPNQGFQSSSENRIIFATNNQNTQTIKVIWPNGKEQNFDEIKGANVQLVYTKEKTKEFIDNSTKSAFFEQVSAPEWAHKENTFLDFDRQKLLPYQTSRLGPALAVGDLNGDALDDVFVGGARGQKSQVFYQNLQGEFISKTPHQFLEKAEYVDAQIRNDQLLFATGGGELYGKVMERVDGLWKGGKLTTLKNIFTDATCAKFFDMDADGDLDVFVGEGYSTVSFGASTTSYIYENIGNDFTLHQTIKNSGFIRDVVFMDFNADGKIDFLEVGEWAAPNVWLQTNAKQFQKASKFLGINNLNGLWRTAELWDIDKDGDQDILLGNWGLNSKFQAKAKAAMRLFSGDFDNNSIPEPILSIHKNGKDYPFASYDELTTQMPTFVRRKFTNHKDFAGKTVQEIFNTDLAVKRAVQELRSGFLRNLGKGKYSFVPFAMNLQTAPINDFEKWEEGSLECMVVVGNFQALPPFQGRLDGFNGAIIRDEHQTIFDQRTGFSIFNKTVNKVKTIDTKRGKRLILGINNHKWEWFKRNEDE